MVRKKGSRQTAICVFFGIGFCTGSSDVIPPIIRIPMMMMMINAVIALNFSTNITLVSEIGNT